MFISRQKTFYVAYSHFSMSRMNSPAVVHAGRLNDVNENSHQ